MTMWKQVLRHLSLFALISLIFMAGARAESSAPLYLSFEQRLELSLGLEIASGNFQQRHQASLFLRQRIQARSEEAQIVKVKTFDEFLETWRGEWPDTQSMSLDLEYLRQQKIPGSRVFIAPDAAVQEQINQYVNEQPRMLRKHLAELGISPHLLGKIAAAHSTATEQNLIEAARSFYANIITEASQTAGEFIDIYFKDMKDKALRIVIRTVFTTYYFALGKDSKKLIASSLLGSNLKADVLSHFLTLLQNSGPILQKILQVIARKDGIPAAMQEVLAKLEDGVRSVPWIQVQKIIEENSKAYVFKSVRHDPLGVGSMAQVHLSNLVSPAVDFDTVVRFIKPGMIERVDEDERILKSIASQLDSNPEYRSTGSPRMGPLVEDIANTVRVELSLEGTKERQRKAGLVYEKSFTVKSKGRNVKITFHAPRLVESTQPNALHVQERVRGQKLSKAVAGLPDAEDIKRGIAEKTAEMFFSEVLMGSGFYHADFHAGNFLVEKISDSEFKINILDYGMGGTLTREFQENLVILGAAITLNKAEKIADLYWKMSNQEKNAIHRDDFYQLVRGKVDELKARKVRWNDDAWVSFVVDQGLALPFDMINLNRALLTIEEVLKSSGSKETVTTMSLKAILQRPLRTLKILLWRGGYSPVDLLKLGFDKTDVETINALPKEAGETPASAVRPTAPLRCDLVYR